MNSLTFALLIFTGFLIFDDVHGLMCLECKSKDGNNLLCEKETIPPTMCQDEPGKHTMCTISAIYKDGKDKPSSVKRSCETFTNAPEQKVIDKCVLDFSISPENPANTKYAACYCNKDECNRGAIKKPK